MRCCDKSARSSQRSGMRVSVRCREESARSSHHSGMRASVRGLVRSKHQGTTQWHGRERAWAGEINKSKVQRRGTYARVACPCEINTTRQAQWHGRGRVWSSDGALSPSPPSRTTVGPCERMLCVAASLQCFDASYPASRRTKAQCSWTYLCVVCVWKWTCTGVQAERCAGGSETKEGEGRDCM